MTEPMEPTARRARSRAHVSQAQASTQRADGKAKRLGAVLRTLREERGISAASLAKQAGLSRSYLNYLEAGKFAEVGLDKFSRMVAALDLSADRVLRDAGYLPQGPEGLPDARSFLATHYGLSTTGIEQALAFLEFLVSREQTVTPKAKRAQSRAKKGTKQ